MRPAGVLLASWYRVRHVVATKAWDACLLGARGRCAYRRPNLRPQQRERLGPAFCMGGDRGADSSNWLVALVLLPLLKAPRGRTMGSMETLKVGDWVRTKEGHEGKIVLLHRLSAFIEVPRDNRTTTPSYLLSELTKIEPPKDAKK